VANDIAELAVVVFFTADGFTVGSLVAVTVLMLGSVLLLLVLTLVLVLVVVTVLGLLVVVAVAIGIILWRPYVSLGCTFIVSVSTMHVTQVARVC
jgi:hypothetical protein